MEWGGEIVNRHSFGRHTSTQMGSGCLSCGIGKAAYMRNLEIALSPNNFEPVQDLKLAATNRDYYRTKKVNSTFFYYGGPAQIKSGGAIQLILDYMLMYFGFVLFLLV